MGWEKGGRYYTRSKKVNGRVIREYVGTGKIAELWSRLDAFDRERRRLDALERRQAKEELATLETDMDHLDQLGDLATRAALLAAGFHQHKRGEWSNTPAGGCTANHPDWLVCVVRQADCEAPRTGHTVPNIRDRWLHRHRFATQPDQSICGTVKGQQEGPADDYEAYRRPGAAFQHRRKPATFMPVRGMGQSSSAKHQRAQGRDVESEREPWTHLQVAEAAAGLLSHQRQATSKNAPRVRRRSLGT